MACFWLAHAMQVRQRNVIAIACTFLFLSFSTNRAEAAQDVDLRLVTTTIATLLPGQAGWIALNWQGDDHTDVCDFQITATAGGGVTIGYPNGKTYTAPYRDDRLSSSELDYTSFFVTVPANVTSAQVANMDLSYQLCNNGNHNPRTHVSVSGVIPVVPNTGPAFTQVSTATQAITAGTADWVKVNYTGFSPNLTNFSLRVTDAAGATVSYPTEGSTSAKLSQNSTLGVKQTDYASLHVDTTGMKAGTYTMKTLVTYGSPAVTTTGTLSLVVK